jgi:hypothetical protein
MNLPFFSLKSLLPFGPPEFFHIFGGCGTRRIYSSKCSLNILAVPVLSLRSTGIPSNAESSSG